MASKFPFIDLKLNDRSFKRPFVAISNVQLRLIIGFNIENAQDWRIYNKGQFEAIAKTNNFQQKPIRMHREHMVTYSNVQKCTRIHGSAR